jgi:hypothetical protein
MTPVEAGNDRMATAVKDAFVAGTVKGGERVVVLAGHPISGGPRFPTVRVVKKSPERVARIVVPRQFHTNPTRK